MSECFAPFRDQAETARFPAFTASEAAPAQTPRQRILRDISAVCRLYGVTTADVMAKDKQVRIVAARDACWWMLRFAHQRSYPQIGALFGRHHSTVVVGVGRHDIRLGIDSAPARMVARCRRRAAAFWERRRLH